MDPLSNRPVGIARASVENEPSMPRRSGARRYWRVRLPGERGQRAGALAELVDGGPEEDLRLERGVRAVVDEQPVHLRRRDAVGERGGDEAARRHADVDVEFVEVEALERIGEREQRADLVDAAERAAAGERESHAGSRRARVRRVGAGERLGMGLLAKESPAAGAVSRRAAGPARSVAGQPRFVARLTERFAAFAPRATLRPAVFTVRFARFVVAFAGLSAAGKVERGQAARQRLAHQRRGRVGVGLHRVGQRASACARGSRWRAGSRTRRRRRRCGRCATRSPCLRARGCGTAGGLPTAPSRA